MGIHSYETLDAVSLAQLPKGPEFPRTTLVTKDVALVSGGFLSIYPGTGNAAKPFGTQSFETSLIGANWVVPFDWNHDGKIDLLTDSNSSLTPGYMADTWLGNNDGTFSGGQQVCVPHIAASGDAVASGDITGDGVDDLVFASGEPTGGKLWIFPETSAGGFGYRWRGITDCQTPGAMLLALPFNVQGVAVGDFRPRGETRYRRGWRRQGDGGDEPMPPEYCDALVHSMA